MLQRSVRREAAALAVGDDDRRSDAFQQGAIAFSDLAFCACPPRHDLARIVVECGNREAAVRVAATLRGLGCVTI